MSKENFSVKDNLPPFEPIRRRKLRPEWVGRDPRKSGVFTDMTVRPDPSTPAPEGPRLEALVREITTARSMLPRKRRP